MWIKLGISGALLFVVIQVALAQSGDARNKTKQTTRRWRPPGVLTSRESPAEDESSTDGENADKAAADPEADNSAADKGAPRATLRKPLAKRTRKSQPSEAPRGLPNDKGQVWRTYDISPYTTRVTSTARPEQAIVDWILRETGYETWHSEPLAILSASEIELRVYHTGEMQETVSGIVDRFVSGDQEEQAFSFRAVTLANPNWRAKAESILKPLPVGVQGIQAWLVQKEDAALLLADLRKRSDFREHSSPHLIVNNGQQVTVGTHRPRNYVRDITRRNENWPAFEPDVAQFEEGFSIEFSPLLSTDGREVDALIKCQIDQIEELVPVFLDVPSPVSPRQRTKIEVPQVTQFHVQERFRWPTDQVLVVGLGMVARPVPKDQNLVEKTLSIISDPPRSDLVLFIENKGKSSVRNPANGEEKAANRSARGRY